MVAKNAVRCINRKRNKVQYFSAHLVNDARWRKMTGYEPQPIVNDPVQHGHDIPGFELGAGTPVIRRGVVTDTNYVPDWDKPKMDIEAEIERRVAERLNTLKSFPKEANEIVGSISTDKSLGKPKRKYTKRTKSV